eukprot:1300448-Rhodomonas_salina.4
MPPLVSFARHPVLTAVMSRRQLSNAAGQHRRSASTCACNSLLASMLTLACITAALIPNSDKSTKPQLSSFLLRAKEDPINTLDYLLQVRARVR